MPNGVCVITGGNGVAQEEHWGRQDMPNGGSCDCWRTWSGTHGGSRDYCRNWGGTRTQRGEGAMNATRGVRAMLPLTFYWFHKHQGHVFIIIIISIIIIITLIITIIITIIIISSSSPSSSPSSSSSLSSQPLSS